MKINGKLQTLLISQLLKHGKVDILLPDGVTLELGITQVGKHGEVVKAPNYCWVTASRADKQVSLDKYNVGIKFDDTAGVVVLDDSFQDEQGRGVRRLDVV